MFRGLFSYKVLASAFIFLLASCSGDVRWSKELSGADAANSSSSSSSSGIARGDPVSGVGIKATIGAISPNFSYGSHAYSSETIQVFGEVCPTSNGTLVMDGLGYSGGSYFDFDDMAGSRLDFPLAGNAGGPVGSVSAEILFSNGTNIPLSMEVWINDQKLLDNLDFPPTGDWSKWQAMHIDLDRNLYSSRVQLSLIAKSALGGPNISAVRVGFLFDCSSATGCGNLNLPKLKCL